MPCRPRRAHPVPCPCRRQAPGAVPELTCPKPMARCDAAPVSTCPCLALRRRATPVPTPTGQCHATPTCPVPRDPVPTPTGQCRALGAVPVPAQVPQIRRAPPSNGDVLGVGGLDAACRLPQPPPGPDSLGRRGPCGASRMGVVLRDRVQHVWDFDGVSPRQAAPDLVGQWKSMIGCSRSGGHAAEIPDLLHPILNDHTTGLPPRTRRRARGACAG